MNKFNNETKLIIPDELTKPRFVQKSGMSKEEAKRICETAGTIWAVK